ncbi:MAG: hypothetical protein [Arizlama microvirus]|nr:MAG: hypothetical protein [Arizlama microvirus]
MNHYDKSALLHQMTDASIALQAAIKVLADGKTEMPPKQIQGILITLSRTLTTLLNAQ